MSLAQRIARFFTSREKMAAIEAESRTWMARCPHCGAERSVWELGGIRAGASGKPRWFLRCAACGRRGWHAIGRREGAGR